MNNELRILPLRKYEVSYNDAIGGEMHDVFTADHYEVEHFRTIFRRTGNVVREYQVPLVSIVVTPVDDEDVCQNAVSLPNGEVKGLGLNAEVSE